MVASRTGTTKYLKARQRLRHRKDPNCSLCGAPIDYDANNQDPWSFSADHIVPHSKGGTDALTNLRAVHLGCNKRRGNGNSAAVKPNRKRRKHSSNPKPTDTIAPMMQWLDSDEYT